MLESSAKMSTKPFNIFISWSGDRSKHIALGLKNWLPAILQTARPWMSETDIDKGARGVEEIGKALSEIRIGIVCLTPENLDSRWVLFEAGALAKTLDVKTRLCTYLLGGLEPKHVPQPLGIFQATRAIKDDTKQLIRTINAAINEEPLNEVIIETLFEPLWPKLEKIIASMPENKAPIKRPVEDMVAELLEMVRAESVRRRKTDFMEAYIPTIQKLFPLLDLAVKQAQAGKSAVAPCPKCGRVIALDPGFTGNLICNACGHIHYRSAETNVPKPEGREE